MFHFVVFHFQYPTQREKFVHRIDTLERRIGTVYQQTFFFYCYYMYILYICRLKMFLNFSVISKLEYYDDDGVHFHSA